MEEVTLPGAESAMPLRRHHLLGRASQALLLTSPNAFLQAWEQGRLQARNGKSWCERCLPGTGPCPSSWSWACGFPCPLGVLIHSPTHCPQKGPDLQGSCCRRTQEACKGAPFQPFQIPKSEPLGGPRKLCTGLPVRPMRHKAGHGVLQAYQSCMCWKPPAVSD